MARLVDLRRRETLLDDVVGYLGEHGLANVSLRPMSSMSPHHDSASPHRITRPYRLCQALADNAVAIYAQDATSFAAAAGTRKSTS